LKNVPVILQKTDIRYHIRILTIDIRILTIDIRILTIDAV